MTIQTPKTIKKVAAEVALLVRNHHPYIVSIDDVQEDIQQKWYKACGEHEMFWQDVDRYMGDVYTQKSMEK